MSFLYLHFNILPRSIFSYVTTYLVVSYIHKFGQHINYTYSILHIIFITYMLQNLLLEEQEYNS